MLGLARATPSLRAYLQTWREEAGILALTWHRAGGWQVAVLISFANFLNFLHDGNERKGFSFAHKAGADSQDDCSEQGRNRYYHPALKCPIDGAVALVFPYPEPSDEMMRFIPVFRCFPITNDGGNFGLSAMRGTSIVLMFRWSVTLRGHVSRLRRANAKTTRAVLRPEDGFFRRFARNIDCDVAKCGRCPAGGFCYELSEPRRSNLCPRRVSNQV